jgi:hypothetical protein
MNKFELRILHFMQDNLSCKFLDATMPIVSMLADKGILLRINKSMPSNH